MPTFQEGAISNINQGQKTMSKGIDHIPGRTVPSVISKNQTAEQRHKIVLKELGWDLACYPATSRKTDSSTRLTSDLDSSIISAEVTSEATPPLFVKDIDLNVDQNSKIHHTVDYVISSPKVVKENIMPGTLIVRRGTEFTVKVLFNRPYNKETDRLHFVFELACDEAKVSKANLYSLDVKEGLKFASWSVCYDKEIKNSSTGLSKEDDILLVMMSSKTKVPSSKSNLQVDTEQKQEETEKADKEEKGEEEGAEGKEKEEGEKGDGVIPWQLFIVRTPPDCIVGRWTVSLDTIDRMPLENSLRKINRFTYKYPLYILFNAWNRADQVFMENESLRDEYVLSEYGKIVMGNYKQITTKPWLYGQFDSFILDCCFHLLNVAGCAHKVRKDAAEICRALSNIITSIDNQSGLLLNSWSGNYGEAKVAPSSWTGSTAILEQYWRTKLPVMYGQCYVFAGVATTICRALGIPCRPVTTFCSAHDCDRFMTIDTHWCLKGNPVRQLNEDAIWSFHVWNEAWMRRPDLFENYTGWQAFDTTPQITCQGVAYAGPSPVKAIKTGNVNVPFNTELLFTEINADIVNWFFEEQGIWKSRIVKYRTGKALYTKKARPPQRRFLAVRTMKLNDMKDVDDVTSHYKFEEGSEEDRSALYRADVAACHAGLVEQGKPDVKFEIKHQNDVVVGSVFDIIIRIQNHNRNSRTVDLTLELFSSYYTGVQKSRIKYETFHFELGAIRTEEAVVHVVAEEYLHRMADHSCFKINVLGTVLETGQVFCEQDDFRLCKPELEIDIPRKVALGGSFDCKIHFMNPTPINLVRCEWILEATGIQRSIRLTQANMEPYEIADLTVTLTARKLGTQYVVVTFNSCEVMDINGVNSIVVLLPEVLEQEKESKNAKMFGKKKESQISALGGSHADMQGIETPGKVTPASSSQKDSQGTLHHDNKSSGIDVNSHKHSRGSKMSHAGRSMSDELTMHEAQSFEN